MKNEQDKKIDDLFRKRLENPDQQSGYREEDWDALENMLDQDKKRRGIVYFRPIMSVAAALIILFLGWWLLEQKANHINDQNKPQIVKVIVPKTGKRSIDSLASKENKNGQIAKNSIQPQAIFIARTVQAKNTNRVNIKNDTLTKNTGMVAATSTNKRSDSIFDNTFAKNHPFYKAPVLSPPPVVSKWSIKDPLADLNYRGGLVNKNNAAPLNLNNQHAQSDIASVSITHPNLNLPVTASNVPVQKAPVVNGAEQTMTPAEKSNAAMMNLLARTTPTKDLTTKTHAFFKPRFTGGVIGAQDINGAGSFKQGKVGSKAGLVFAADVSQKLTISTGAVYSSTPYTAGANNFNLPYQSTVNPVSLSANCQMLDIPVNIGYQVYNKGKNTFSLGTGLSSYIMLQQDYNFAYSSSSGVTPKDYSVPNSSSYLFKILNLNATYQRKISSKAGVTVQPYLKLPLADIGYSQVKLQTTGVAVGLTWSLDSSQP